MAAQIDPLQVRSSPSGHRLQLLLGMRTRRVWGHTQVQYIAGHHCLLSRTDLDILSTENLSPSVIALSPAIPHWHRHHILPLLPTLCCSPRPGCHGPPKRAQRRRLRECVWARSRHSACGAYRHAQ